MSDPVLYATVGLGYTHEPVGYGVFETREEAEANAREWGGPTVEVVELALSDSLRARLGFPGRAQRHHRGRTSSDR